MSNATSERLANVHTMFIDEYRNGLRDGISTGLQVAERILVWFKANAELKEPHSLETLVQWSEKELQSLRSKMDK